MSRLAEVERVRRAVDDDFEPQEGRPGERGLTRGGASGAVVALVVPARALRSLGGGRARERLLLVGVLRVAARVTVAE